MVQAATPQHGRTPASSRPAWLVPAIVAGVVVLAAGIVAIVLANRGAGEAVPTPTPSVVVTTVVAPVPTPALAPVPRQATSTFAAALPVTVLQYALASSAADDATVAAGALEAWVDQLTDGGIGTVTVAASQWATPQDAAGHAAQLVAALPTAGPTPEPSSGSSGQAPAGADLPQTGDVLVAGAAVGTYTIAANGPVGVAVWTNGTAVFQLTGPVEQIVNLYNAYGL